MKENIEKLVKEALLSLGVSASEVVVEHPTDLSHGDYATNAALAYAKEVGKSPRELAEGIVKALRQAQGDFIEEIKIAGPGFINFHLSKEFFEKSVGEIVEKGERFGRGETLKGEKIMVEYTDPNVMKPFHIGHLMSNSIGEAISRITEWNGADVMRMNYYSDSGLGIAKAVWGMKAKKDDFPKENASLSEKAKFLGSAYAYGVSKSAEDEEVVLEVKDINKKIFSRDDEEVNKLYDLGKKWSLEHFEELYKMLGTTFDWSVGESEVSEEGKEIVLKFLEKGIFEKSEGAIVFHGEKYNPHLHTRVFISKENLPIYEAKELGLTKRKFEKYDLDQSVVITASEQNDYFKVVLEALKHISPDYALKTKHISHGMLRLPTGKMSSRTGNVITAEELIDRVKEAIKSKGDTAQEEVAIGAIKYMILRQSIGNDIVFDFEKSVSTEGDSGVYLQYAYVRANSILSKANVSTSQVDHSDRETHPLEKMLYRFPEIVERAMKEYAPNYLTTYLTEIAGSFNNLYAHEQIISDKPESVYLLSITEAFKTVMKNGLTILGIPTPEKM